jgi:hypothetical protein
MFSADASAQAFRTASVTVRGTGYFWLLFSGDRVIQK